MTIVDLTKARAYADGATCTDVARDWILSLADEVESLQEALESARAERTDLLAKALQRRQERDQAIAALEEVYQTVARLIASLPGEK